MTIRPATGEGNGVEPAEVDAVPDHPILVEASDAGSQPGVALVLGDGDDAAAPARRTPLEPEVRARRGALRGPERPTVRREDAPCRSSPHCGSEPHEKSSLRGVAVHDVGVGHEPEQTAERHRVGRRRCSLGP